MSFARALFELYGKPTLQSAFTSEDVTVEYAFDNTVARFKAIIRDVRIELVQDDDGTLEKRTLGALVIDQNEFGFYGGIENPQLKGIFTITTPCGEQSRWSIASVDGNAIQAKTDSFVIVNIIQTRAAARSQAGFRT